MNMRFALAALLAATTATSAFAQGEPVAEAAQPTIPTNALPPFDPLAFGTLGAAVGPIIGLVVVGAALGGGGGGGTTTPTTPTTN